MISQYFTRDLVKRCSAKNLFGSIAAFTCSPLLARARRRFFRSADRRPANLGDVSSMYVVIEDLTDLEKKLGLTKEIVEARVFAVLRKNGLKPVEGKPEAPHFYNVNIKVVGNACAINVGVMREVTINNGIGAPPFSRNHLEPK